MNAPAQAKLEPGVYPGIPEDEYFSWKAVSNSKLSPMAGKTPLHCKYAMDHPSEPKEAMILGSAVDTLVFIPTLFGERFAIAGQCEAITQKKAQCSKMGSMRWDRRLESQGRFWWICKTHGTGDIRWGLPDAITILTPDQSSTAYAMAKAVLNDPGASVLLAACEHTQLSLVWHEINNPSLPGLLCKARLDGISTELKTIVDLKKCQDASPEAFARSIANYGYHRQAAMYLRGATYHEFDVQNYVIIAVEEPPPHAVALYTLTERTPCNKQIIQVNPSPVEYGNHELMRLLDLYERCETSGEWPGYPSKPVPIALPAWTMAKMERE